MARISLRGCILRNPKLDVGFFPGGGHGRRLVFAVAVVLLAVSSTGCAVMINKVGEALVSGNSVYATDGIHAVPLSPQVAVITQYYNYAKNMTDLNLELLVGATVIDKWTWNKIPTELHAPLLQVMQETGKKLRDEIRKSGERDVDEMKKRGLNVVPIDTKAREAWVKVAESAYPKLRDRIVGAEAFDEAMKYRDEYRKRAGTVK